MMLIEGLLHDLPGEGIRVPQVLSQHARHSWIVYLSQRKAGSAPDFRNRIIS